jgi:hypothetical protein
MALRIIRVAAKIQHMLEKFPAITSLASLNYRKMFCNKFSGSEKYWIERYQKSGNSGAGSYGKDADFKAEILNTFVNKHSIETIIEYGCGDGNQLRLAKYKSYLGYDVSPEAINRCKAIFSNDKTKEFKLMNEYGSETADLVLSLDVIYHLIENDIFDKYMKQLFFSAKKFVIIYSTGTDGQRKIQASHIKHRKFTRWIENNIKGFNLIRQIPNKYLVKKGIDINTENIVGFYIYEKSDML